MLALGVGAATTAVTTTAVEAGVLEEDLLAADGGGRRRWRGPRERVVSALSAVGVGATTQAVNESANSQFVRQGLATKTPCAC